MTQSPDDSKLAASVCQLAMAIFDLPGAALKLYEGARLITIGAAGMAVGLPDPPAFTDDRNLSEGLCVADAARDSRFFLEPVVLKAQGVRFYADAPLLSDGHLIGLLSVLGNAPRHDFDARRQALLAAVADIAAVLMTAAESARDREALQAALEAQTARLDRAATLTHFGYWTIDLASRELHWSDGLYALYGLDRDSFTPGLASHFDSFGEAAQEVLGHVQRAVAEGTDFDFTLPVAGAPDRLLRTRGGVEYDRPGGLPVRICAVVCAADDVAIAPAAHEKASLPLDEPLMRFTQELRHPLKDILETAQAEHPDMAAYSDRLRASADALQTMLGETLDADASEPPVPVADVIREAVEPFIARARALDNRLNLHFVDFNRQLARLDVMRLEQVLHNLIGNACQFTRGGVISVTASQVQAENAVTGAMDTRLHISVRDSGPGMSDAEAQDRLNGRKAGGLGLSVARTLVELLDGHIGIHARPGEGTHVWFEIPLVWADAKPARPRHLAPDPVLAEPQRVPPEAEAPLMRGPAYLPRQASAPAAAPAVRSAPVDEDRINREYLRALLQDMKLGLS